MSQLYFCGIFIAVNCLQMCISRLRLMFEIRVCGSNVWDKNQQISIDISLAFACGLNVNSSSLTLVQDRVFDIFFHALTNFSPLTSR